MRASPELTLVDNEGADTHRRKKQQANKAVVCRQLWISFMEQISYLLSQG
jgi:hypothetical protein